VATQLIRQVAVVWSGIGGSPYYSQFHFEHQAGAATASAVAVKNFLQALASNLAAGMTAQVQDEQNVIDTSTGKIVSVEAGTHQSSTAFIGTGDPLPFATQVLLRLSTAQFNDGRRLRGRMFIPGNLEAVCQAGALAPASFTTYNTPAQALLTASSSSGKWAVWSKRHLGWASVDSVTVWDQFAILRKRRP
jgi:hypothetical protein